MKSDKLLEFVNGSRKGEKYRFHRSVMSDLHNIHHIGIIEVYKSFYNDKTDEGFYRLEGYTHRGQLDSVFVTDPIYDGSKISTQKILDEIICLLGLKMND